MDMGWLIGLAAVFLIFGGGSLIQKWIEGENEAKRIRAENQFGKAGASAQVIEELRQELAALRETTTRFDMSFDAEISRMEQRMKRVEGQTERTAQVAQTALIEAQRLSAAPAATEPQPVQIGSRH